MAALQEARPQAAQHQAWLNAINRAAEQWAFDGETLVIASATTQGARYIVRDGKDSQETGQIEVNRQFSVVP